QRVMALLPGGGYAEEAVVHHGSALAVPETMSDEEAGAFPEVFLTAFSNLFMPGLGALAPGEAALVHGGGGGVGTAAILLCREAGNSCFVTAGGDEKCRQCVALGATAAINYRREDFSARTRELTSGRGVDVVLDHIVAAYLANNLAALAPGGRLVVIGLMGGAQGEVNLAQLLIRRRAGAAGAEAGAGVLRAGGAVRVRDVLVAPVPRSAQPEPVHRGAARDARTHRGAEAAPRRRPQPRHQAGGADRGADADRVLCGRAGGGRRAQRGRGGAEGLASRPLHAREPREREHQGVRALAAVALRGQREIELLREREARQRKAHPPRLRQRDAQVLDEVVHAEARCEVPRQHARGVVRERPGAGGTARDRLEDG